MKTNDTELRNLTFSLKESERALCRANSPADVEFWARWVRFWKAEVDTHKTEPCESDSKAGQDTALLVEGLKTFVEWLRFDLDIAVSALEEIANNKADYPQKTASVALFKIMERYRNKKRNPEI